MDDSSLCEHICRVQCICHIPSTGPFDRGAMNSDRRSFHCFERALIPYIGRVRNGCEDVMLQDSEERFPRIRQKKIRGEQSKVFETFVAWHENSSRWGFL